MKSLIVDDEDVNRFLLNSYTKPYGDSTSAADGSEAVELFIQALDVDEPFDVVFLDIMMPILDGQEVLTQIRELEALAKRVSSEQAAKVIMTTALNDGSNVMTAFKNQADGYLVKPIRQSEFDDLLTKLGFSKAAS